MNIEKAMRDPGSVFACPDDVFSAEALSVEMKIKILRCWEYDARELQVAEEENMGGGPPDILEDILKNLHRLGADLATKHPPPTKQGGE